MTTITLNLSYQSRQKDPGSLTAIEYAKRKGRRFLWLTSTNRLGGPQAAQLALLGFYLVAFEGSTRRCSEHSAEKASETRRRVRNSVQRCCSSPWGRLASLHGCQQPANEHRTTITPANQRRFPWGRVLLSEHRHRTTPPKKQTILLGYLHFDLSSSDVVMHTYSSASSLNLASSRFSPSAWVSRASVHGSNLILVELFFLNILELF